MSRTRCFFLLGIVLVILVGCGKKAEGPAQRELTNEEKIKAKLAIFKTGYQDRNVNQIMSLISDTYYDNYNPSKAAFGNWLQSSLSGWEWTDSLTLVITSSIDITLGWYDGYHIWHPTTAVADFELTIKAKNTSQDLQATSRYKISSGWEESGTTGDWLRRDYLVREAPDREVDQTIAGWVITRLTGPVATLGTSPISIAGGSSVKVFAYTLPYGAPLQNYDTKNVSVVDWKNDPITLTNLGSGRYEADLTAPSTSGEYTLTATLSDTTTNKTISVNHAFVVQ